MPAAPRESTYKQVGMVQQSRNVGLSGVDEEIDGTMALTEQSDAAIYPDSVLHKSTVRIKDSTPGELSMTDLYPVELNSQRLASPAFVASERKYENNKTDQKIPCENVKNEKDQKNSIKTKRDEKTHAQGPPSSAGLVAQSPAVVDSDTYSIARMLNSQADCHEIKLFKEGNSMSSLATGQQNTRTTPQHNDEAVNINVETGLDNKDDSRDKREDLGNTNWVQRQKFYPNGVKSQGNHQEPRQQRKGESATIYEAREQRDTLPRRGVNTPQEPGQPISSLTLLERKKPLPGAALKSVRATPNNNDLRAEVPNSGLDNFGPKVVVKKSARVS